jgi:hypothetical protein
MSPDYWHGVNAALEGNVINFKTHLNEYEYIFNEPPINYTAFSKGFINGYMSVIRGEHHGWIAITEYTEYV